MCALSLFEAHIHLVSNETSKLFRAPTRSQKLGLVHMTGKVHTHMHSALAHNPAKSYDTGRAKFANKLKKYSSLDFKL